MGQSGLTLIELLIAIAVMSLLLTMGMPHFSHWVNTQRQQVAAYELASALKFARMSAVHHDREVLMHPIDGNWALGWRITTPIAGQPEPEVLRVHRLNGQVPIIGNTLLKEHVRFIGLGHPSSKGSGPGNGTLHVCAGNAAVSQWRVVVAVTGRIRLDTGAQAEALCGPDVRSTT